MSRLVEESIFIIREAKAKFKKICVLWSTGKDSTTILHLIKESFFGEIPFPVVHIDTGFHFRELLKFRDKIAKKWGFNLVVIKNEQAKATPNTSRFNCCTQRKTLALKKYIEENKIDAVLVSIRCDEHGIRGKERVFSPRTSDFKWLYLEQPTEIWNLYQTEYPEASHVRVHPIIRWSLIDVWKYVKKNNLPVNPLYFKGYTSLGCKPCTVPTLLPPPKTIDEIIQRLKKRETEERAGRAQDKEQAYIMQRLRALGYM